MTTTATTATANTHNSTAVSGPVRALLRVEGLLIAAVAVGLYARSGASWWLFGALLLVPDLSLVAYLANPRVGAIAYNALHSIVGPLVLGAVGLLGLGETSVSLLPIAFIWAAHVGGDRALGYGLKYGTAFGHTHLGVIGRAARVTSAPSASAVEVIEVS